MLGFWKIVWVLQGLDPRTFTQIAFRLSRLRSWTNSGPPPRTQALLFAFINILFINWNIFASRHWQNSRGFRKGQIRECTLKVSSSSSPPLLETNSGTSKPGIALNIWLCQFCSSMDIYFYIRALEDFWRVLHGTNPEIYLEGIIHSFSPSS